MFILYFGGQKSGKSKLAEQKALELSGKNKPYYIATYNHSYKDAEMQTKINAHKKQRADNFITIEEDKKLHKVTKEKETYLIDCISMWILNNLDDTKNNKKLFKQLDKLTKLDTNIVFVLNDVNSGVIPIDKLSRKFIDMTGIIGQKIASFCDEVYEIKLGIAIKIK